MNVEVSLITVNAAGQRIILRRRALLGNNSQITQISHTLAEELGMVQSETVVAGCAISRSQGVLMKLPSRFMIIEHPILTKPIKLLPLIHTQPAFIDIVIGQDGDFTLFNASQSNPPPTPGPGFDPNVIFMGHNLFVADKDRFNYHVRCLSAKFALNFDGSSHGNPGKGGGGVIFQEKNLSDGYDTLHRESIFFDENQTSNEAEYLSLIHGLNLVIKFFQENKINENVDFVVRGDSQLVINQLKSIYEVKAKNLISLYVLVRDLTNHLKEEFKVNTLFYWIPREDNVEADGLANDAIQHSKAI